MYTAVTPSILSSGFGIEFSWDGLLSRIANFCGIAGTNFREYRFQAPKGIVFEPFCSEIGFTDLDLDRDFRKGRDLCINFHLLRSAVDIGI